MKKFLIIIPLLCFLLSGCALVRMGGRINKATGDVMVQSADEEEAKRTKLKAEQQSNNKSESNKPQQKSSISKKEDASNEPEIVNSKKSMTVMQIQQRLSELGYKPGPANGKMDKSTVKALKKFQQDNGLSITGQANDETVSKLSQKTEGETRRPKAKRPPAAEKPQKASPAKAGSATDL